MSIKVGDDQVPYIDVGDNYKIRLEYEEVTDEFYIEKARTELRETPENIAVSLKELRELLQGTFNSINYSIFSDLMIVTNPTRHVCNLCICLSKQY